MEFAAVLGRGQRSSDPFFQMRVARTARAHARLGISVSRRVSPKAVVRNRIKRQIREVFRHYQQELAGLDVVVLAQAGAGARTNPELRASLQQLLKKIALKCKAS